MTASRYSSTTAARLAASIATAAWLWSVLSPAGAVAAEVMVKIANFTFAPHTITVPAGTTVTWVNDDDIPHIVAEKEGAFRSKALDTGDKFSQPFAKPGKVEYYCAIHPHMTGEIVVTP